ncbi:hypothetical protein T484DRAFT_1841123 [Baffinella frigidus]|nr:hypothetical protein T484DRAFT_1841123 [Cryptophyta sp. CCMP2293]
MRKRRWASVDACRVLSLLVFFAGSSREATVGELKKIVTERMGVPASEQQLSLRGGVLRDGTTLAAAGVTSEVALLLTRVPQRPTPAQSKF